MLPPDPVNPAHTAASDRREDDKRAAAKAPRKGQDGPIGFGAVLKTVGKQRSGANQHGNARAGAKQPGAHRGMHAESGEHGHAAEGHEPAASTTGHATHATPRPGARSDGSTTPGSAAARTADEHHHAAGTAADASASAVDAQWVAAVAGDTGPSSVTVAGRDTPVAQAPGDAAGARAAAAQDLAGAGGKVTPARAMALIEDVARSMDRDNGARELHIHLEPEHLGPLAVKLTVDQRGIRARIATRTDGAAAILGTGTAQLRERLLRLGYASADVEVAQDDRAFDGIGAI